MERGLAADLAEPELFGAGAGADAGRPIGASGAGTSPARLELARPSGGVEPVRQRAGAWMAGRSGAGARRGAGGRRGALVAAIASASSGDRGQSAENADRGGTRAAAEDLAGRSAGQRAEPLTATAGKERSRRLADAIEKPPGRVAGTFQEDRDGLIEGTAAERHPRAAQAYPRHDPQPRRELRPVGASAREQTAGISFIGSEEVGRPRPQGASVQWRRLLGPFADTIPRLRRGSSVGRARD